MNRNTHLFSEFFSTFLVSTFLKYKKKLVVNHNINTPICFDYKYYNHNYSNAKLAVVCLFVICPLRPNMVKKASFFQRLAKTGLTLSSSAGGRDWYFIFARSSSTIFRGRLCNLTPARPPALLIEGLPWREVNQNNNHYRLTSDTTKKGKVL